MTERKIFQAIGCMSGTSVDGIDIALIETDGHSYSKRLASEEFLYSEEEREIVKAAFGLNDGNDLRVKAAADIITKSHINALKKFDRKADLIGFHGQTIYHAPADKCTVQIGDAKKIAQQMSTNVIYDMRKNDVANGGQGAPLLPLYHAALVGKTNKAICILNIGGVSNVTYINNDAIIAFDTGPGNALIDDWILSKTGKKYDKNGEIAAIGKIDQNRIDKWLSKSYFSKKPAKSLDRQDFIDCSVNDMSIEDGTATLTTFTIQSIVKALDHFPQPPEIWYVTGGGRHNNTIMAGLSQMTNATIEPIEKLDANGDSMEAEGFAYLAVRSELGLPLTLPTTTGCQKPLTGGKKATP